MTKQPRGRKKPEPNCYIAWFDPENEIAKVEFISTAKDGLMGVRIVISPSPKRGRKK